MSVSDSGVLCTVQIFGRILFRFFSNIVLETVMLIKPIWIELNWTVQNAKICAAENMFIFQTVPISTYSIVVRAFKKHI